MYFESYNLNVEGLYYKPMGDQCQVTDRHFQQGGMQHWMKKTDFIMTRGQVAWALNYTLQNVGKVTC